MNEPNQNTSIPMPVRDELKRYIDACYPDKTNLTKTQYLEVVQAFLSGGLAIFSLMSKASAGDVSDIEATERVQDIYVELVQGIKALTTTRKIFQQKQQ